MSAASAARIISPYGAGGSNGISGQMFAERFAERMGQQFVVEDTHGAGTRMACELVADAPADGKTLLYAALLFAVAEGLYSKVGATLGVTTGP